MGRKNKSIIKCKIRIFFIILVFSIFIFSINSYGIDNKFQMEWNKTTSINETWKTINLNTYFIEPIVVATPEYNSTTNANGISTWIRNVTNTSFEIRTSDENFASADNITVHYLVIEKGSWTLPNSNIKIQAGYINTNKYGYKGNYKYCPNDGETIIFKNKFNNNPLVLSTRGSDNNPNIWAATIQSAQTSSKTVSKNSMCLGLSRSKAGTATFTNNETIYWVAIDEGNGSISNSDYEILWNLKDTGDSGGNWINGYGDAKPFTESWSHTWSGTPKIILASQTSIGGSDGSWPVIYDTGNTGSIRMFVDESNERSHGGSESGGGFAFNSSNYFEAKPEIIFEKQKLDIGYGIIIDGNISKSINIESYKNNSNIKISCISGNCSTFSNNFSNSNLTHRETQNINFTCSNSSVGIFNAIFSINSTEDTSNFLLNISCEIFKIYGELNSTLISPIPETTKFVAQNQTFKIKASVKCVGDTNTSCGNVTGYARYNGSINKFGNGNDGIKIINSLNTVVNNYTYLTGNENSGDDTITVNSVSEFKVGDEILIIQMQNSSGTGKAGNYEFKNIKSISGSDIILNENLINSYGSGSFNSTTSTVTQIVKVPQYKYLTINSGASITSPSWNGYVGGIVIFRVLNKLNTTGYVNVSGLGYRGGSCNGCGNAAWGNQGEGISGIGGSSLSSNTCGGGGGYGPSGYNGEPGAGGGHATSGDNGVSSYTSTGGKSIGENNLSTIFFGGGAGGGGDNDNVNPFPEYVNGGGIAIIFANEISNGRIIANGDKGLGGGGAGGTTGGGAGGSIWLISNDMNLIDVNASGGVGGIDSDDTGGNGGNGRIRLDYNSITGTSTPTSGFNGSIGSNDGMKIISNISGDIPFYTNNLQPQNCGNMSEGDTCTLTWIINATGKINSSHLIDVIFKSNVIVINEDITKNTTINITDNIIPEIELYEPINNNKLINNGSIEFIFKVEDDSDNVSCNLYINDILNFSGICDTGINLSITQILNRGYYNWTIEVTDDLNNTINSTTNNFLIINPINLKLKKTITSINTNQYLIQLNTSNNLNNMIYNNTILDFVNNDFNYGSFTKLYDNTNSSSGIYTGTIILWDWLFIDKLETNNINYSIAGISDYNLLDEFIIGLN